MKHTVNVAIQVLPTSTTKHPYKIVDKAIEVIQKSGIKYEVCPFETVMEGTYDEIMKVVKEVQQICYENETDSLMTYLKIQSNSTKDVTIEDKMHQYK